MTYLKPILLFSLMALLGCKGNNKLKVDQDVLVQKITAEDSLRIQFAKQLPDTTYAGIRFDEDRSVAKSYKLRMIDIANQRGDSIPLKLSDIATVQLLPLENLPDTSNYGKATLNVKLTDNYIVVYGMSGIYLYGRDGRFIKTLEQSKVANIKMRMSPSGGYSMSYSGKTVEYEGAVGEVYFCGDELYYTHYDSNTKSYSFRKCALNSDRALNTLSNVEDRTKQNGGELVAHLSKGMSDGFNNRLLATATTIPLAKDMFVNVPSAWSHVSRKKDVTIHHSTKAADTLCSLSNPNRIDHFSHRVIKRGSTRLRNHWYNGQLSIYSVFSDTVFRVVPPSRYVPAYVFNFGDYKIDASTYFAPHNLKNKLCVSDQLVETDKYLYIEFYDTDSKVTFGRYDKRLERFNSIDNGKKNRGLVDDVFGYYCFWPKRVNANNETAKLLRGSMLKYLCQSDLFAKSTAAKKQQLVDCAEKMSDDNLLLIIYKLH